jgi:hypothetical protein
MSHSTVGNVICAVQTNDLLHGANIFRGTEDMYPIAILFRMSKKTLHLLQIPDYRCISVTLRQTENPSDIFAHVVMN